MGDLSKQSDAELVRSIQLGSPASSESQEAVSILYGRHHECIFRYLFIRLFDRQQAEDLTSDVFIRMVASLPRYEERELPFLAWLYKIARNLLVDHYRKKNDKHWMHLDEVKEFPMKEPDPFSHLEDRLAFEEVRQALDQIDALQREVIRMRFLVGLPIKDVAVILDKSVPTIKAMQFRGLQNLRTILETAQG